MLTTYVTCGILLLILFSLEIPEQSVKMATRSPSCLQFEVHCHHFPVSILHHLLTPPPSDSPTLPYILKSKPDTTQNQVSLAESSASSLYKTLLAL